MNRTRARLITIPLFCALFVGVASAVAEDAPLFDYREILLDNGLRVVTLEDFSCPIVAVQLWYHVGSKDEDPRRQGFAHMFEHMMFRGTDRLGPTDHFENIRRAGGESNAYTFFDQTVYHETLPAHQLELALWLEAERMAFLNIDQESFDTERKVVEEERRLYLNRPYGTLLEKALAELFQVHPYRWSPIGQIPHLRAAHVQELRDFWTRYYAPTNATLVIVGAVRHEDAQRLARRYFEWIPRNEEPPRVTVREPAPTKSRSVNIKEDNAPAPLVAVAYHIVPVGHEDEVPLQLLGMILGGGESSRLYRELVAEKELAVFAAAIAFSLEDDGIFGIGVAMSPLGAEPKKVMKAIGAQIKRLRSEPVSERELLKARNQMLRDLVTENLTVNSKARALGSAAVLEGDVARVNDRLEEIRRVTADDLQRVANAYLARGKALMLNVERNLLGTLFGKKKEEYPPVTAEREEVAPTPGRPGATRPADYPETPPVAGLLEFDPTVESHTQTLANGLKVIVVPNHEVPFVSVNLGLKAGAWTESKPGVASMTLSMLTKGTEKHTEGELADELETYAISLSGSAEMDMSRVGMSCVTEQIGRAVNLMAEVVRTPTFPEEEFSKLRKQVLTGLAVANSEPSYVAERELRRRLYGNHPYSRTATGEIEDVRALNINDLPEWWKLHARPDTAVLLFAGDIEFASAVKLAEAAFGDWKAEGPPPAVALSPPPEPAATQVYLVDRPGVQSQIRVGQLGITLHDPGYFTSRVVSQYFGGAFNSRLNEKIRVEKGLTYGARGGYRASRFLGEFKARTFSKLASTVEALQLVLHEIGRLPTDPPNPQQLADTKSYILGNFASERETPQQVASQLWRLEVHDLPEDYYSRLLAGVAGTGAEDCVRLARETVDPSKLVIVVVGSAARLKDDLAKIAPVTVVKPSGEEREAGGGVLGGG